MEITSKGTCRTARETDTHGLGLEKPFSRPSAAATPAATMVKLWCQLAYYTFEAGPWDIMYMRGG